jgi:hypothetical protein
VAAWLSETVLRGCGPGASGFESHRRGRIFSKEGNSVCVCLVGVDGSVVEGRSTLFRPPRRGQHGFESRREKGAHGCINVVYVCECCVCL